MLPFFVIYVHVYVYLHRSVSLSQTGQLFNQRDILRFKIKQTFIKIIFIRLNVGFNNNRVLPTARLTAVLWTIQFYLNSSSLDKIITIPILTLRLTANI